MDRRDRVERPVLYLLVLVLATAVGYLVLTRESGRKQDDLDLEPIIAAIGDALDRLGPTVADAMDPSLDEFKQDVARDVADRVEELLSHQTEAVPSPINAAVARTDEGSSGALEGRIADAVANKLLAAGCTLTGTDECDECPPTPCPPVAVDYDDPRSIKLNSRFTFFFENARLNEDRQVTADSFGVKPAARHLKRLELLSNAFQPCHRADAPVEFAVTGFASTAEFRVQPTGEPMSESDELNLMTANLRAQNIGEYLQSRGFNVQTKQWSENDLQRPYLDDGQSGVDQQAVNRTVFIDLKSAGACDLTR